MLFVSVVKAGSYTKASLQLAYSKSQISRRMALLEQTLGVTLFLRSVKGITLTQEGRLFYDDCLTVKSRFEEAKEGLKTKQKDLNGHISMTAPMSIGSQYIGPLLANFLKQHPLITVSLDLSDHPRSLQNDDFDLAIRASAKLEDSQLRAKCLYEYDYVIAGSDNYFKQFGTPVMPDELKAHRAITCLTTNHKGLHTKWPFSVGGEEIEVELTRVACVTHMDVQKQFALADLGLIRVPRYWVEDALNNQTLVSVLSDFIPYKSNLYAVYKNLRIVPLRLRVLIDYFAMHLPNVLKET